MRTSPLIILYFFLLACALPAAAKGIPWENVARLEGYLEEDASGRLRASKDQLDINAPATWPKGEILDAFFTTGFAPEDIGRYFDDRTEITRIEYVVPGTDPPAHGQMQFDIFKGSVRERMAFWLAQYARMKAHMKETAAPKRLQLISFVVTDTPYPIKNTAGVYLLRTGRHYSAPHDRMPLPVMRPDAQGLGIETK